MAFPMSNALQMEDQATNGSYLGVQVNIAPKLRILQQSLVSRKLQKPLYFPLQQFSDTSYK